MGVYDRDYYRRGGGPPVGRRVLGQGRTGLSVTAWIIIACVAVFVVDGFMARQLSPVEQGNYFIADGNHPGLYVERRLNPLYPGLPSDMIREGTVSRFTVPTLLEDGSVEQVTFLGQPILTEEGLEIGKSEVSLMTPLRRWLHFSTNLVIGGAQLWRLIGFQFLHADFQHLVFNMIGLFFFGPLVESFLGRKRYLAFYLLCGAAGAVMYLGLNLLGWAWIDVLGMDRIAGLLFNAPGVPLIGASAGVFGVIIGGAILQPNARVLLFFVIPMKLSVLAVGLIAVSVIFLVFGLQNAGGEAAHLGGAIAGWYFIRRPDQLHGLFNFFGRVDPTSRHFAIRGSSRKAPRTGEIDAILDKISREGLQSLSKKEKRLLAEASRKDRGRS